jgi:hypothetical protein
VWRSKHVEPLINVALVVNCVVPVVNCVVSVVNCVVLLLIVLFLL